MRKQISISICVLTVSLFWGHGGVAAQTPLRDAELFRIFTSTDPVFEQLVKGRSRQEILSYIGFLEKEGKRYFLKGDYEDAEKAYKRAGQLSLGIGNKREAGNSRRQIGLARLEQWNLPGAKTSFNEALEILDNTPDPESYLEKGYVYIGISKAELSMWQLDEARNLAFKAHQIGNELQNNKLSGVAELQLAEVYSATGMNSRALSFVEQAKKKLFDTEDYENLFDCARLAYSLFMVLGEYDLAEKQLAEAQKWAGENIGASNRISLLAISAEYHNSVGNGTKAIEILEEEHRLARSLGMESVVISTQLSLAETHLWEQNFQTAKRLFEEALSSLDPASPNSEYYKALIFIGLAKIESDLGNKSKANDLFKKSNKLMLEKFPKSNRLKFSYTRRFGEFLVKHGRNEEAFELVSVLAEESREIGDLNSLPRIYALQSLIGYRAGKFSKVESTALMQKAVGLLQTQSKEVLQPLAQIGLMDDFVEVYRYQLEQRLAVGEIAEAFIVNDSSKSRWLKSRLSIEAIGRYRNNWIDSDQAKRLRTSIYDQTLTAEAEKTEQSKEQRELTERLYADEYQAFQETRSANSGSGVDYSDLKDLSVLLDRFPRSAFISYGFTHDDLVVFVLRKDREIKAVRIPVSEARLRTLVRTYRDEIRNFLPGYKDSARTLHKLLIEPVAKEIKDAENLNFVPDGFLWELPFQALIDQKGNYLVEKHAVSYVPSLAVFQTLVGEPIDGPPIAENILVAFGNPVNKEVTRLPASETEVSDIAGKFPRGKVFSGQLATESNLKKEISKADILHLATHGKLDTINPLESAVYLTPDNADDGRFEVREIINEKLKARLVVLSACDTSNGVIQNGEGMLSLTWAFLAAGSKSVVATQWSVESISTARNMVYFYDQLQNGKSKAESIRAMMKSRIADRAPFNHPFYWAGFVSVGDFR